MRYRRTARGLSSQEEVVEQGRQHEQRADAKDAQQQRVLLLLLELDAVLRQGQG